jgi:ATP/maltotriose-dependent transcriptional regulator MalT
MVPRVQGCRPKSHPGNLGDRRPALQSATIARVTSSRLIGRSAELAELEAALADAADGRASVAFVAGESGVGKTRLVQELMGRARDEGALVLAGETVDFGGESELPYLPFVSALRPLARSGFEAPAVASLLGHTAAEGSQAQLFESLLALLAELGRDRPVLLVLEDLHWADGSSRAALAFLVRSLTDECVLVVGSYRTDELDRQHPLRPLVAELERDPRTRRLALDRLTRDELAEQLTDLLGAPPDAELLKRLWSRAQGNPLFSEELLAAGLGPAPDTLRDALMLRVERLSPPVRELLGLLAVGQRLDHRLLGGDLREAVDANVVVAHEDGTYAFRHPLLREVVEDDLLPGERAALHLTLARALEAELDDTADPQSLAAVAHHYGRSDDRPAAFAAAVKAAGAAAGVHAHGEALALHGRALELWDRVPDPEALAGADRATVLEQAAGAAAALGDPGRALELLEAALAGLGAEPDPARAAPILKATGSAQRHLNRADESIATLERALALAPDRAPILAALARAHMIVGNFEPAIAAAREALSTTEEPHIEGHARNSLGFALAMTGEAEQGAAELREAIRIATERDNLGDLPEAYVNYADMLHILGRSDEARAAIEEGRRAIAGRRPIGTQWLDMKLAEIAFDLGEWDLAEASLPAERSETGTQSRLGIGLRRAALAVGRGEHDAADELLGRLRPLAESSREPQVLGPLGILIAERRRREGDLEGAASIVDDWLEEAFAMSGLAAAGVTAAADAAVRARDVGDSDAAAVERLESLLARLEHVVTPDRPVEQALLLEARAEAGRGAGRPDPAAYARAAAAFDEIGRREPAARMRWRAAEVHADNGDAEQAGEAARAAHAAATSIGAGWLRGEIEGLAARARISLEREVEPAPEAEDPFGLTARERQVLAVLADGASNREIGERLFMAEKTASVHVSRILAKLNVRSRTAAAAAAHRHGLSGPA